MREQLAANPAQTPGTASTPQPLEDKDDFSLVLGGPLYQLLRRSNLYYVSASSPSRLETQERD